MEVFKDVRLVGAPPVSIGKFGGDTDNWMWPRQTGDFSIFDFNVIGKISVVELAMIHHAKHRILDKYGLITQVLKRTVVEPSNALRVEADRGDQRP